VFSQLHCHNHIGSRLDAIGSPGDYAKRAMEFSHTALATTDHGRISSFYEHQVQCLKYGIKPIFGVEMYLVNKLVEEKNNKRIRTKTNHIILLAKDEIGYKSLLKINYLSMKDKSHFYYVPRITMKELIENKERLIVGSGCMANPMARHILNGQEDSAKILYSLYLDSFGDNFYTEVQLNELEEQKPVNDFMIMQANKYGVPIVVTGDVHYLEPGQSQLQTLAMAIRDKTTIDNIKFEFESKHLFFHDIPDYLEFNKKFNFNYNEAELLSWCHNSEEIAKRCNFMIPDRDRILLPKLTDNDEAELIKKAKNGIINKFGVKEYNDVPKEYRDRLKKELEVIIRKGFASYFLIVDDITQFSIRENIYGRIGRGCYTKDAMIFTTNGYKHISDVKIGDVVIDQNCEFDIVENVFSYDIEEELYQFSYKYSSNTFSPKICTGDHKQLVKTKDGVKFLETKEMKIGDYLCFPKIKYKPKEISKIDLNSFNKFGFEYDDDFIYEKVRTNKKYEFSKHDIERKINIKRNIINNYINEFSTEKTNKAIFNYCKMKPKELKEHIEKNSFIYRKIKRYLTADELLNNLIGLLAGDGWIKKDNYFALACHSELNKNLFLRFCNKQINNYSNNIYINESEDKKLIQIYCYSKVLSSFLSNIVCYSENKEKFIKDEWLQQDRIMLKSIMKGLLLSDGHIDKTGNYFRYSFDNTSLKLISNYCEILMKLGYPYNIIKRKEQTRGNYQCRQSYKVRFSEAKNIEDEDYIYLPVKEINKINKTKTKVFDLQIKNKKSFVVDNFITHNSVGGSLLAYVLGIHNLDPIKRGLLFERFLSDQRSPDLVIDYFSN